MVRRKLRNSKRNQVLDSRNFISTCVLLFSLCACQTSATPPKDSVADNKDEWPEWVTRTPEKSGYIYAVGSSKVYSDERYALNSASESARAELAKVIRVVIEAETVTQQTADSSGMDFHFSEAIINAVPKMELSGVKTVNSFIDKQSSTAYVLASFNKTQAINELNLHIDSLDSELEISKIELSATSGKKLAQAIGVKKLVAKRGQYNEQLVNLGKAKVLLTNHTRLLLDKANTVFNEITFAVTSGTDAGLQDKIIQVVTEQGVRVSASDADFHISYTVKWRDIARNDLFYSIANATVTLSAGDTVLRKFKQKAKGTSSDRGLAKDKALEKIGEQFAKVLSNELLVSFENAAPKATYHSSPLPVIVSAEIVTEVSEEPVAQVVKVNHQEQISSIAIQQSVRLEGVTYQLLGCDRSSGVVSCHLTATNGLADKKVTIYNQHLRDKTRMVDLSGNEYNADGISIGAAKSRKKSSRVLVKGIPFAVKVTFTSIDDSVTNFALFELVTRAGSIQYRAVKISP